MSDQAQNNLQNPYYDSLIPLLPDLSHTIDLLRGRPQAPHLEPPAQERLLHLSDIHEFFEPSPHALVISTRILSSLRQFYQQQNPFSESLHLISHPTTPDTLCAYPSQTSTLSRMLLCGVTQTGKTQTVERLLAHLPQVIHHHLPLKDGHFYGDQIVWIRIRCPARGTLRAMILTILHAIDKAIPHLDFGEFDRKSDAFCWMNCSVKSTLRRSACL